MFSNVIFSLAAFLVALGVLISIHEFGHYWVARRVGIKVLKFSIGFGKPLWSRTAGEDKTEYVIAAIPLGGYVKMLDEREGNVKPSELHRAFNRKSVWQRIAVVIAGPLANFLLAIVVYWIVMMTGISGIAPLLGDVDPDSPAADAGLQFEDRILAVASKATPTWSDARIALLQHAVDGAQSVALTVESAAGDQAERRLTLDSSRILMADGDVVATLGINQWWPKVAPVIGGIQPDGAAMRSGLMIGDRVLTANAQPIEFWDDWVLAIRAHPEQEMDVEVERNGEIVRIPLTPGSRQQGEQTFGFIGAWEVESAEAAQKARVIVSYPVVQAFSKALSRTWEMSVLTLRMLQKLLVGQASIDNISGPISIAKFAGQSASVGLDHYLNFIALISISLAVLNLLPIPLLDGGHLLYYAFEIVFRRPLSDRVQALGQQVGIMVLGALMMLAFYNDIWRLLD